MDITVNRYGILWFLTKTHQITRAELKAILASGDEIVVGMGLDSNAHRTEHTKKIATTVDLRVVPTPEVLALYNELIAQGRNVVSLARSTCFSYRMTEQTIGHEALDQTFWLASSQPLGQWSRYPT